MIDYFRKQGIHEKNIYDHFGGNVVYMDEIIFNFPLFIIAFTNRTGSNLLASRLHSTGLYSVIGENLNYDEVIIRSSKTDVKSFPAYIAGLVNIRENSSKIFGIKASWDQLLMICRWGINRMFSDIAVVHIERESLVEQAVSFSIAGQTKRWTSEYPDTGMSPVYNRDDIDSKLYDIVSSNQAIIAICDIMKMRRLRVTYEELVKDPDKVVGNVARFSGVIDTPIMSSAGIRKQASENNTKFSEMYRAEAQEIILSIKSY